MRILVTGAGGQLGRDLVRVLRGEVPPGGTGLDWWGAPLASEGAVRVAGLREVIGATHPQLAVEDRLSVLDAVEGLRPDVVVHAGAWTAVDACESDPDRALAVNALGTRHVAEACARRGAHLVYVSSDYVFDGVSERPYHEWDTPGPLSIYGASKRGGELECPEGSTVVRTSWLCSAEGPSMLQTVVRLASDGRPMHFVDDQRGCPTFTADLANGIAALALDRRGGTFHVTNQGSTSWYGFARAVLEEAGRDPDLIRPVATAQLDPPRPAPRPKNSVLDNAAIRLGKLPILPEWRDALRRALTWMGERPDDLPDRRDQAAQDQTAQDQTAEQHRTVSSFGGSP